MQKIAILSLIFFLVNGCSSVQSPICNISAEEKIWLEKFFRHFLFYDTAIYTLTGSKPITSLQLIYYDKPEDELREANRAKRVYFELNGDNPKDIAFYKRLTPEEKTRAFLINGKDYIYNFEELWDRWEQIQSRFRLKNKFLLIKRKRSENSLNRWKVQSPECIAIYDVLFINVPKAALVIQENYDLFKQVVGIDFDPLRLVFDLKNDDSEFWNKIASPTYSYLWGLLFGFGKENAFCHYWKWRHLGGEAYADEKSFGDAMIHQPFVSTILPEERNAYTISKFPLPAFASFSEEDPVISAYEAERERIKRLYKGKDFVLYTLELLTQVAS